MNLWSPVPFAGGSYADETMPWTRQDTVNYLPTRAERSGARSDMILKQCPGMRIVSNLGNGPIRATYNVEGMLLAVSGDKLFRIGTDYIGYLIGTIPGVGRISVAHNKVANGNQVLFATGSSGYVYSTADNSLAPITDEGYPGAMCVRFIGQYFAQIEPQRRYWFISDLADGFSYNTLDTYEAEAQPDKLYSLEANAGRLFAFGERTIECYDNLVSENAAFQRSGIVIDRGVASGFATCVLDNAIIFIGNDGVVYRMDGYNPVRISHHPLETALAASDLRRAFFTTWEDRGHKVAYLTLQDGNTWGWDVASQEWHRRESYGLNRWRANTLTKWNGQWIAGDYANGKLYRLEWDLAREGFDPLVRERTFAVLHNDFNPVRVNAVRFLIDTGGPESVPQGDPAVPAIGPTITGSAPDGIVGEEYSFTYTTTAGDAAIVKTTIDETALLAGLEWDESTATISGTPTVAGTMTITPRVIDANGLWAELSDSIAIGAIDWIATDGAGNFNLSTGTDWTTLAKFSASATGNDLLYSNGVLVCSGSDGAAGTKYSTDRGATFADSTVTGSASTGQIDGYHGNVIDGTFWIGQGGTNIAYSTNGASFTSITPTDPINGTVAGIGIGGTADYIVSGSNDPQITVTHDGWINTSTSALFGTSSGPWAACIGSNGARTVVFSNALRGGYRYTDDGSTWSTEASFPSGLGDPRQVDGHGNNWVVAGSSGIAYSTDNAVTWTLVTLGETFVGYGVRYGGGLWVACGDDGAGGGVSKGRIWTASDSDLTTWTKRANNFGSSTITGVAYIGAGE